MRVCTRQIRSSSSSDWSRFCTPRTVYDGIHALLDLRQGHADRRAPGSRSTRILQRIELRQCRWHTACRNVSVSASAADAGVPAACVDARGLVSRGHRPSFIIWCGQILKSVGDIVLRAPPTAQLHHRRQALLVGDLRQGHDGTWRRGRAAHKAERHDRRWRRLLEVRPSASRPAGSARRAAARPPAGPSRALCPCPSPSRRRLAQSAS